VLTAVELITGSVAEFGGLVHELRKEKQEGKKKKA